MKSGKTRILKENARYDKANHRQKTPADPQRGGGGRDEERRLKENAGAMTRETSVKILPRTASVAGGDTKRRTPAQNGKVAQPTFPRGAEVPS